MRGTESKKHTELWKELHNDRYRMAVAQRAVDGDS